MKIPAVRLIAAAATGIAVTLGLLFLMQLLIATGEDVSTEPRHFDFCWMCLEVPRPEPEPLEVNAPEKPARPAPIPALTVSPDISGKEFVDVRYTPPPPATDLEPITLGGAVDSPLMTIFKVAPVYPPPALVRKIEGYVIVRYDVSAQGAVSGAQIVESSDNIFDAAVVTALNKFRYQPRTVDGVPQETKGLERMFRFEIEKEQ
jgi:protein TonB